MKAQITNILGFAIYVVSVTTIQLCHYSRKVARQYLNKWALLCFNKTLFTRKGRRLDLAQKW